MFVRFWTKCLGNNLVQHKLHIFLCKIKQIGFKNFCYMYSLAGFFPSCLPSLTHTHQQTSSLFTFEFHHDLCTSLSAQHKLEATITLFLYWFSLFLTQLFAFSTRFVSKHYPYTRKLQCGVFPSWIFMKIVQCKNTSEPNWIKSTNWRAEKCEPELPLLIYLI